MPKIQDSELNIAARFLVELRSTNCRLESPTAVIIPNITQNTPPNNKYMHMLGVFRIQVRNRNRKLHLKRHANNREGGRVQFPLFPLFSPFFPFLPPFFLILGGGCTYFNSPPVRIRLCAYLLPYSLYQKSTFYNILVRLPKTLSRIYFTPTYHVQFCIVDWKTYFLCN